MRYCRYEDEQKCEMNKEISMKAIEEASHQKQGVPCVLVCVCVCAYAFDCLHTTVFIQVLLPLKCRVSASPSFWST